MREEPSTTTDALRDLSESVRQGARLIAGSLILSALIIAAMLSPDRSLREGAVALLLCGGLILLILFGLRREFRRWIQGREKLRVDRARKVALSGRAVRPSPASPHNEAR